MDVKELTDRFGLKIVAGKEGLGRVVRNGYCGDLLSDVMGNTPEKSVWLTVQGHQNIVAVAVLRQISAIIIVGKQLPDDEVIKKADEEGIPVLLYPGSSFELSGKLWCAGIGNIDSGRAA